MTTLSSNPLAGPWPAMRLWLRRFALGVAALAIGAALVLAAWGIWRWATYPTAPDLATADINTAISFMGSDDFNRLLERHRLAYAMGVVDRLAEGSFADLMKLMMRRDANRAQIARNIRAVKGYDQIGSRMFALFLEKYYDLSPAERQAALLAIVAVQQAQIGSHPDQFTLPSIEQFKGDMARFMSRQPPRVQAMCGQFLIDLKRQRDALGLRDPF